MEVALKLSAACLVSAARLNQNHKTPKGLGFRAQAVGLKCTGFGVWGALNPEACTSGRLFEGWPLAVRGDHLRHGGDRRQCPPLCTAPGGKQKVQIPGKIDIDLHLNLFLVT